MPQKLEERLGRAPATGTLWHMQTLPACCMLRLQVDMVIVGDDCALPHSRLTGRRGIAGTILVHKVAGAAAAAGDDLASVRGKAAAAAACLGSMGAATRACTLPGTQPADPPR